MESEIFDDGALCHEVDNNQNHESHIPADVLQICQTFAIRKGVDPQLFIDHWLKIGKPSPTEFEQELVEVLKIQSEKTVKDQVDQWISESEGWFFYQDVCRDLNIQKESEKNLLRPHFSRLVQRGILERGDRNGKFRRIIVEEEDLIILDEVPTHLPIKWPCGVQEYCQTFQKSLVVIAGSQNAGKTAYALNAAYLNRDWPTDLFFYSSEMGEEELTVRISYSKYPLQEWRKIKFKKLSMNFSKMIRPNAFNIIDFLECPDGEFYRMGSLLKEIYDALGNGIALVCLQKHPKSDTAWGGHHTKVIPRIYLTLDHDGTTENILRIEKGKLWNSTVNPYKLSRKFKLVQGINFNWTTGWQR